MINPGDPEGSYVIHKLTGHNFSFPADHDAARCAAVLLGPTDIQTIYDWICEGAPSN